MGLLEDLEIIILPLYYDHLHYSTVLYHYHYLQMGLLEDLEVIIQLFYHYHFQHSNILHYYDKQMDQYHLIIKNQIHKKIYLISKMITNLFYEYIYLITKPNYHSSFITLFLQIIK